MTQKDKDLPKRGMSREELIAKHKFLDGELSAQRRRRVPDEVAIRRLKRLKAMYKVLIADLQPKPVTVAMPVVTVSASTQPTADIIEFPDTGFGDSFAPTVRRDATQPMVATG